jgi:hypothetical protein
MRLGLDRVSETKVSVAMVTGQTALRGRTRCPHEASSWFYEQKLITDCIAARRNAIDAWN